MNFSYSALLCSVGVMRKNQPKKQEGAMKSMCFAMNCLMSIAVVLLSASSSYAETKTWSPISPGENWNAPENWTPPGIPGSSDNVIIPEGTSCHIPDGADATCGDLTNRGNLYVQENGKLKANGQISNESSGKFKIEGGPKFASEEVECDGFTNDGDVEFENGGIYYSDCPAALLVHGLFENNGDVSGSDCGGQVSIKANSITNNGNIEASLGEDVFIVCNGIFTNNGGIFGGYYWFGRGGNVDITCYNLMNNGGIIGGDGNTAGGDVYIVCNYGDCNNGNIRGGFASSSEGAGGQVFLTGNLWTFRGRTQLEGGEYCSGIKEGSTGSVKIYADSIYVAISDTFWRGDDLHFQARAVVFDTLIPISGWAAMYSFAHFEVFTTFDGLVDFTNIHTNNTIMNQVFHDSMYLIYTNDRRDPVEGLANIFAGGLDPWGDTSAADTTLHKYAIMWGEPFFIFDTSGISDSFYLFIKNLCLGEYTLNYSVYSSRGWITPVSGTSSLTPFSELDSFLVSYTIPTLPEDTVIVDIVHKVVYYGTDTIFHKTFYIYGSLNTPLDINETDISLIPDEVKILAHPHPFNSSVEISVAGVTKPVDVEIFDISGKLVHIEKNVMKNFVWKPKNHIKTGIYLVKTKPQLQTRKILFIE